MSTFAYGAPAVWSEALALDHGLMDAQHRRLVEMVGELGGTLVDGGEVDAQPLVEALVEYARVHFESEEGLMARAGYAALGTHRDEHDWFSRKVLMLQAARPSVRNRKLEELYTFLLNWTVEHIQGSDRAFWEWVERDERARALWQSGELYT